MTDGSSKVTMEQELIIRGTEVRKLIEKESTVHAIQTLVATSEGKRRSVQADLVAPAQTINEGVTTDLEGPSKAAQEHVVELLVKGVKIKDEDLKNFFDYPNRFQVLLKDDVSIRANRNGERIDIKPGSNLISSEETRNSEKIMIVDMEKGKSYSLERNGLSGVPFVIKRIADINSRV